jgi:bifunctional non-homologous end joining protein LigD
VALREYRRKRDPGRTPEPFASTPHEGAPIFVVQRHDARRLHFDFRLERDGALASWAVPKGVPMEPGTQRLAVHVEDHPLEYASFAGEIPQGNYGAGSVEIWDAGTYELVEEKKDGGLTVRLHGKRLEGLWTLVPARLSGDEKNWLLIRKRETDGAGPAKSVARRDYRPTLATSSERLPSGAGWLYEVKWDGYRVLARVEAGEASFTSRNGNDLTGRFASVAAALPRALRSPSCVLDGEVCALDDEGRPSFSAMQQGAGPLVLYLFDLLEVDGEPLVDAPLEDRRAQLDSLVVADATPAVKISAGFEDGEALLRAAQEQRLEGVMAKRLGSRYAVGRRTRDWLKVKTHGRQEFVIAGYTRGQGRRASSLGALVLGVYRDGELEYAGNCGTGFDEREIERLLSLLRPLERKRPSFREAPKMAKVKSSDVVWVEPKLVCEVEFTEWTHDGRLRAPSYKGLRDDKPASDVRREEDPVPEEIRKGKRVLRLSNLDKPFWPDEGITKGDLIAYYRQVAPALVPHLRDRPFTMKRYPDGWQGKHFFQKDAPKHMPEWIATREFPATSRDTRERRLVRYALVDDELALLWMVNMACIDMNVWYSRVDLPHRPDFVLFDLDPSDDVGFPECVEVALLLRELLQAVGLECYPKTSGADGMHVLVPIGRRSTYEDTREFSEIVAGALARTHRGLVTTEWSRAKRRGVLIDANQNGAGKTIASVYSVRPHLGAPVSTPLRWDEVVPGLDPKAFTMDVVVDRVARDGDLFAPVLAGGQSLAQALQAVS